MVEDEGEAEWRYEEMGGDGRQHGGAIQGLDRASEVRGSGGCASEGEGKMLYDWRKWWQMKSSQS